MSLSLSLPAAAAAKQIYFSKGVRRKIGLRGESLWNSASKDSTPPLAQGWKALAVESKFSSFGRGVRDTGPHALLALRTDGQQTLLLDFGRRNVFRLKILRDATAADCGAFTS